MTDLAVTRSIDHGPSIRIGEQGLQHQRAQPMAAAIGAARAEDGRAGKRQIVSRVERLVAHELVGEAKPLAVDDAIIADGDSVLKRSAKGETRSPEPLHVLHEAEGAGAEKPAAERARIDVDLDPLRADQRRVEIDLDVDMETVVGGQLAGRTRIFHTDPLPDVEY